MNILAALVTLSVLGFGPFVLSLTPTYSGRSNIDDGRVLMWESFVNTDSSHSKYATNESLRHRTKLNDESPILSQFSILSGSAPEVVVPKMCERLANAGLFDLTVGERGAVGRTVHLADERGQLLGNGVIGWN